MADTLPNRQWLLVVECADYIGVSSRTIRRMCESGKLIAFRIGTGVEQSHHPALRIRKDSLLAYIRRACQEYELETGAMYDTSDSSVT